MVVDGVSVAYRPGPQVVDNISLSVLPGEWLALIGPNGAGKSSLLKAMASLIEYSGTIRPDPADKTTGLAYVPQGPTLPVGMTVAEYVLLGRSAHLGWLEVESDGDRAIADEVIARLSLVDFADREVTELSGGEAQRVTLGRALAQQAAVVLLDEPTSALDLGHTMAVLELIDELRRQDGLTVITAMHDLGTAGRFADRLGLLHNGRLVALGAPDEVLTEELLTRYYDIPVEVVIGADGARVIVPLRQATTTTATKTDRK